MDKNKIKDIFCYGMTAAGVFLIFLVIILILYGIYSIRAALLTILFPFLAAFIIAYLLKPLVNFFCRQRIPRSVGILIIYAVFTLGVILLAVNLVPSLINELQKMMVKIPDYTYQIQAYLERVHYDYNRFNIPESVRVVIDDSIEQLQDLIVNLLQNITENIINFFSHIFLLVLIPLLVFYILKDLDNIRGAFMRAVPPRYRRRVRILVEDIDITLGSYIRSQFLISFLVASMIYVGLIIFGVEFAIILAIINGITNIIPYFGPFIGAVPAVFVSLLESPLLALKVILMITFVQQIESHIIAPTILGRNLKLHPVVVILALLTGGSFFGFFGLIFAVPVLAVIRVVIKHLYSDLKI
ncbi:MAG: hypothetical protein CVU88_05915 [Firmicutes bacterium HGW-Firmicutes-13]|nr:MAG: hypothetical protein CVU88_05915 [Firmicutes bacterium HGW-Firmicutes-13]